MTEAYDYASDELVFAAAFNEIPATYRRVWRWASAAEAELWENSLGCIPRGLRDNEDLAVTVPDTDKPPETGWLRLEFWIDSSVLKPHAHSRWMKISAPIEGTPIIGLRIYFNERIAQLRNLSTRNPH